MPERPKKLSIPDSSQLRLNQRLKQLDETAYDRDAEVRRRARQRYLAMSPEQRKAFVEKYGETLVAEMIRE